MPSVSALTPGVPGEPEPDLAKVLRLHDALAADDVPHAFGEALAAEAIRELQSDNLDVAYVTSWLTELVGGDDTRIERLKQLG